MSPSASEPKKPSGSARRISFTSSVAKSASNFAAASFGDAPLWMLASGVLELNLAINDASIRPASTSHPPDLGDEQPALRHRLEDPDQVARRRAEHVEHLDD